MPGPNEHLRFKAQEDLLRDQLQRTRSLQRDNGRPRLWSPQLIASSVSPTYDPALLVGSYRRTPGWIDATFQMKLADWSPGAGIYALRVPWSVQILLQGVYQVVGRWFAVDASNSAGQASGVLRTVSADAPPSVNTDFWLGDANGLATTTGSSPWVWEDDDVISGVFSFELAPGY